MYSRLKSVGDHMRGGVALVERPVLTMRVLLFLQERRGATLSDMMQRGWNRCTTEASLRKAVSYDLIERQSEGSFPRFRKTYSLTEKGEYVARFVRLLEREADQCLKDSEVDFCRIPKGCLVILANLCRKRVVSISKALRDLSISPNQLYRCLTFMEERGIVSRTEHKMGSRIISTFTLSEKGFSLAAIADALDSALQRVIMEEG
jgi:DNA-binding PadR family transcriptional regulator